jgi:hypothetical protein
MTKYFLNKTQGSRGEREQRVCSLPSAPAPFHPCVYHGFEFLRLLASLIEAVVILPQLRAVAFAIRRNQGQVAVLRQIQNHVRVAL